MEEVYRDRDQFASLVREVAAPDVGMWSKIYKKRRWINLYLICLFF